MSIRLQGLRTVIYPVQDLAAATSWWTALLGVAPYFNEQYYVGFAVAGYELGLLPDASPADGALIYWGVDRSPMRWLRRSRSAGWSTRSHRGRRRDRHRPVLSTTGSIVGFICNPHFQLP